MRRVLLLDGRSAPVRWEKCSCWMGEVLLLGEKTSVRQVFLLDDEGSDSDDDGITSKNQIDSKYSAKVDVWYALCFKPPVRP